MTENVLKSAWCSCKGTWKRSRVLGALNLDFRHRCPMDRLTQGKGCNRAHSAGFPRKRAKCMARSRTVRVGKVVHPCRDKSFRKAMSAVMDDLVTDSEIVEDLN